MKSHLLTIKSISRLTPSAVNITFEIPENLQSEFIFNPGQYLVIEPNVDGEDLRRSYSICSSEMNKSEISIGVKELEGGKVSTYLNQKAKAGDKMKVFNPDGMFTVQDYSKELVFVAGGSGITPIMSMMDASIHRGSHGVHLYYSAKNEEEMMFFSKLEEWSSKYAQLNIHYNFTQAGNNRLNLEDVKAILGAHSHDSLVFACGPNELIEMCQHAFSYLERDKNNFHREYFTEKSESEMQAASVGSSDDEPLDPKGKAQIEIKNEGKTYTFECKYNETILEAGLDADADPPYSCMVAACSTCRALVKSGQIEMKDRDALTDKEIERGYVLTCQSMPRSKKISIDYDA